jgi:hypothetical protein
MSKRYYPKYATYDTKLMDGNEPQNKNKDTEEYKTVETQGILFYKNISMAEWWRIQKKYKACC